MMSERKIFIWNLLGSIASAAISVLLLMIVTRLLTPIESDFFAYVYSLANMLLVIALFQVRNFQATDIAEKYSFKQYILARILTSTLMIVIMLFYLWGNKYSRDNQMTLIFICLYRLTDAISDLFQGYFQQHSRLDIAGKSLTFRNILVFITFSGTLLSSKNLLLTSQVTFCVSLLFVLFYDVRKAYFFEHFSFKNTTFMDLFECLRLLRDCFPLFINGFLIIYIYNQPKYAIEALTGSNLIPEGSQTIFNILFMPAMVMNLILLFFRPQITQMAVALNNNMFHQFNKIQLKLFAFLTVLVISVLIVSGVVGLQILSLLYHISLKPFWSSLMMIMLGGAFAGYATIIDSILTAMRKQHFLLIPYIICFLFSLIISNKLVELLGVYGASLSFTLSMIVWLGASTVLYFCLLRKSLVNREF